MVTARIINNATTLRDTKVISEILADKLKKANLEMICNQLKVTHSLVTSRSGVYSILERTFSDEFDPIKEAENLKRDHMKLFASAVPSKWTYYEIHRP